MSIEVIYQGLTIAKGPGFRLQDGGVFVELDGPMPVATPLSLVHGDNALHGRVRRVTEGAGAGMLIVPTASAKLPRWLMPLGPTSVTNVELEPEPAPAVPVVEEKPATATEPVATAATPTAETPAAETPAAETPAKEPAVESPAPTIRIGEPAPSGESATAEIPAAEPVKAAETPAAATAEAGASAEASEAGEVAAASGHTPSEPGDAAKDDEEDEKHAAKPTDKKTAATGAAKKKKPRKR